METNQTGAPTSPLQTLPGQTMASTASQGQITSGTIEPRRISWGDILNTTNLLAGIGLIVLSGIVYFIVSIKVFDRDQQQILGKLTTQDTKFEIIGNDIKDVKMSQSLIQKQVERNGSALESIEKTIEEARPKK